MRLENYDKSAGFNSANATGSIGDHKSAALAVK